MIYMPPNQYFYGMNPRQRKDWRRNARASGVKLVLCRMCGFPTGKPCPVCSNPPKDIQR